MKIRGEIIDLHPDNIDIDRLKFFIDNPRVCAYTHGVPEFEKMPEAQQQEIIYKKLLKEPSVKNLIPDIKRHKGLMEPILIRYDTMEVIEGNSRLAVFRKLHSEESPGEWDMIPCDIASSFKEDQLVAYLSQIHVKGKTKWTAYEKANFAFVQHEKDWTYTKIAELFGESVQTLRTRIKVIKLMKENKVNKQSLFSYYDVIVRNPKIYKSFKKNNELKRKIIEEIKSVDPDNDDSEEKSDNFTAGNLRKMLPVIMKKPKVLNKYLNGRFEFEEAYTHANISQLEVKVKHAKTLIDGIEHDDVMQLMRREVVRFNAFRYEVNKLSKKVARISKIVEKIKNHGTT